ncbi:prepilin-type N-terminal cleavage/methylation domain-containing protein [Verrucomicrobium sp. GAS474]|uniref:prepilin-type N-terminal cleavage/methylation domain-containing protein n=1 Tax=Verrucomicrobium sp. GAS474 TaxID=1882831 RepID=UPI00087BC8B6|nr:prepilin-type N-terminal cleavage/methylation domain-containing protein [Verrucomicrobium sp. GAS474]SDU06608.1 prepilin-type N-terminal cleavage/methylation domain-containing protein [Verrucomicrobium sp. GAS474]
MKRTASHLRRGFTLLEVMLALAVFAVVAGGLFGTIRGMMKATATLREAQRDANGIYGVFELCRRTFAALPSAATILSTATDGATPLPYELVLENASSAFIFGDRAFFYGEIAMTAHTEGDGTLTLGVEYRRIDTTTGLAMPNPLWLPLLTNLKEMQWHYYDATAESWEDTWTETTRPALVQLTLMHGDDPREWTQTFWLPTLAAQPSFSASAGGGGGGGNANRSGAGGSNAGGQGNRNGGNGNANGNGNGGTGGRQNGGGGGNRGGGR